MALTCWFLRFAGICQDFDDVFLCHLPHPTTQPWNIYLGFFHGRSANAALHLRPADKCHGYNRFPQYYPLPVHSGPLHLQGGLQTDLTARRLQFRVRPGPSPQCCGYSEDMEEEAQPVTQQYLHAKPGHSRSPVRDVPPTAHLQLRKARLLAVWGVHV